MSWDIFMQKISCLMLAASHSRRLHFSHWWQKSKTMVLWYRIHFLFFHRGMLVSMNVHCIPWWDFILMSLDCLETFMIKELPSAARIGLLCYCVMCSGTQIRLCIAFKTWLVFITLCVGVCMHGGCICNMCIETAFLFTCGYCWSFIEVLAWK